jgi:cell division septation protein DedD
VDVSLVDIPEDLVGIRAYVRWENAGMPEDTSPEWQATEYAQARLDLQTEVAQGTTLNDIRRRYNQPVVPGDDEPVVIDFATHARTQNNVVQIHTEPDAKADADRARLSEDAATAAAAAEADLAARVAAAAAATPPPPVERTVEPSAPFAPSIEITKEPAAPAATPAATPRRGRERAEARDARAVVFGGGGDPEGPGGHPRVRAVGGRGQAR